MRDRTHKRREYAQAIDGLSFDGRSCSCCDDYVVVCEGQRRECDRTTVMGRLSLSQWSNGQTSCGHGRLERSVTSQRLILLAATLRALLVLSLACPGSSV
eukprot:COSAG02_NODE_32586_length_514_cov_0.739759_1_plen_99_part_01